MHNSSFCLNTEKSLQGYELAYISVLESRETRERVRDGEQLVIGVVRAPVVVASAAQSCPTLWLHGL